MTPTTRKLSLIAHVSTSVGWLGAVAAFLALAIAGFRSNDALLARAAYLGMGLVAWWVILPLCIASLVTGIAHSLGTEWGLFRHWWVVAKLAITVLSTLILLAHMTPISYMASVAASTTFPSGDLKGLRVQLVVDAAAALGALLVATTLSVIKPRGLTRYGWRRLATGAAVAFVAVGPLSGKAQTPSGAGTAAPAPSAASTRASRADSAAVAQAVTAFHDALSSGDSARVLSMLLPTVRILESGGIETRDQYRGHHLPGDIAFAKAVKSVRSPMTVTVVGDVAWVSSTSTATGEYLGRAVNSSGAELMVLLRTPEGWRVAAIHWSSRRRAS